MTRVAKSLLLATVLGSQTVYSATSSQMYVSHAVAAIEALNTNWYSSSTGLWDKAWWQSGNALTTLADFALKQPAEADKLNIKGTIQNTFEKAQLSTTKRRIRRNMSATQSGFPGFINEFYDDEGWWALGLIHSYDATGDESYLESAVDIFNDMQRGGGTPCKGGIFWNKDRKYVNAVANELYMAVAASLGRRIPSNGTYAQIASDQWAWFKKSGMINGQDLINDGLDGKCKNNGLQTWTINQGVILGAAVELSQISSNGEYLSTATTIAKAATKALSNSDGILVEVDHCETQSSHCGLDAKQFKGVFIRNLGYLDKAINDPDIKAFICRNADSIWAKNRDNQNRLGVAWAGPVVAANGATQGSGLDAFVAAI